MVPVVEADTDDFLGEIDHASTLREQRDPLRSQTVDLVVADGELGENLTGLRAERGGRCAVRDAVAVGYERECERRRLAELLEDPGRARLLVVGSLRDVVHGRDRNAVEPI